jgi:D-glycero-alpha-D-manno-heptose-7-phosphate kinase
VCNIAVAPGARVRLRASTGVPVTLIVGSTGERYAFDPCGPLPGRHALLEHAIAFDPPQHPVELAVDAAVPPGCGTGTSAAVVVALLAALAAARGETPAAAELAAGAHAVEIGLGLQSGVQDQHAAARGGVQLLEIDYPEATSTELALAPATIAALDERLLTVWLGRPHRSSALHETVITGLEGTDPEPALAPLRAAATAAAAALVDGDLDAYGAALVDNTRAQAALHPDLVGPDARLAFEIAAARGATGWKVNGAGGDGGSVTIVGPPDSDELRAALAAVGTWSILDLHVSPTGAHVTA